MIFQKLFQMTTSELYQHICEELVKYDYTKITKDTSFIAAKGNIPIVLAVHMDTVFDEKSRGRMMIFYDEKCRVFWSPMGLGADDRAGVAMILTLLDETSLRPHLLFTTDEESKGDGAYQVAMRKEELFGNNIKYVIQLDRQGYKECVFYQCPNKAFEKYINTFGFITNYGTYTDISVICPEWNIAGVNLSVGYYYEHSYIEHFYLDSWIYTYKRVVEMLENPPTTQWKYGKKQFLKEKK